VHGGLPKDKAVGSLGFPIYQTCSFSQDEPGRPRENYGRMLSYARSENPTRTALEAALAEVEESRHALAFASGLAAVTCVMNSLDAGDEVVACGDLYGGCYRMFTKVYSRHGIRFRFVDTTKLENVAEAVGPATKMLWLESPSNPLLNVTDLEAAANVAKQHGATVVVDNTFASPVLQRPLRLGADVVVYSTTKYHNGHSDVIGGALCMDSDERHGALKFIQNACGLVPGPQDCWLVLRGLKTIELRMERQCDNADAAARHLARHPRVARVHFPGLESHPGHEVACRQMRRPGAMVSLELHGGEPAARKFLSSLRLFTLAESLGGTASLANHPATMTHASVEPDVRESVGITGGLIRLSLGIENGEDLLADLDQALEASAQ
jgi:cystathionine beta-lyase/cystathionine gamma-synthase